MTTIKKFKCKGNYEIESGYASYRTIANDVCETRILCNEIVKIDPYILDDVVSGSLTYCSIDPDDYENNPELKDQYESYDDLVESCDYIEYKDIYQYYLTGMSQWDVEYLNKYYPDTLIIAYSEKLDLYVLCVDHFGTSWDYVLTDVEIEEV